MFVRKREIERKCEIVRVGKWRASTRNWKKEKNMVKIYFKLKSKESKKNYFKKNYWEAREKIMVNMVKV